MALATSYLDARAAAMQEAARLGDVDKVVSLCLSSLVYEHPRVGIRLVGVDQFRSGLLDFLGSSRRASVKITATLPGRDMVAVRTDLAFEAKEHAAWRPVHRTQVWVFEFEGPKIKRIIEYW